MRKITFLALLCAVGFSLSACDRGDQDDIYSYLLMHPRVLKNEHDNCQKQAQIGVEPSAHCTLIEKAFNQVMVMLEDQQKSPEKFGQGVLHLQFEYSTAEQASIAALKHLETLRANHASAEEIHAAETQYAVLVQKMNVIRDKVGFSLAVIGISSPE